MIALAFFLLVLIIAPQLWLPPFIGLPVDFIAYPLLLVAVVMSGRLAELFRLTVHDALLLAFVSWIAVSAVVNGLTAESTEYLIFYFKVFVLYKLASALLWDLERVRRFIAMLIAFVIVLGFEVLSHYFSEDGLGWAGQPLGWVDSEVLAQGGKGRARWVGIFDGPGVFAVLFTIALPFMLPLLGRRYGKHVRLFAVSALALILVATYLVGSRGGMVATFAVVSLWYMIRIGVKLRTIVLLGVTGMVLYSVAPEHLTTIRDQSNSTQYRVEMWAEGVEMMKQNPLFGIGRGNFKAYTSKLIAHNSAVEIGGETGLVGLFLWLTLIYACIKSIVALRLESPDERDRDFCIALVLCVVGYFVSAMFVTLEYETFYLLLAACAGASRSAAPALAPLASRDYVNVAAAVVAGLLGLQMFVIMYLR
jgi:O-antigen ligase